MKSNYRFALVTGVVVAISTGAALLAAAAAPTGPTVKPVFDRALPNAPGKKMMAMEVVFAPGGKSVSHRHPPTAFIYAYVVSGQIRSQVAGEPARVYNPGEGWYENPGAHHVVSENASATLPAKLLAVFVMDANDSAPLVTPDP
jgi:quercetin dioxygenase-like cupin family protein